MYIININLNKILNKVLLDYGGKDLLEGKNLTNDYYILAFLMIILNFLLLYIYIQYKNKKLKYLSNLNNENPIKGSEGSSRDNDNDNDKDPKDKGFLASLCGALYDNRYTIGITVGIVLFAIGGYFVLNHYDIIPPIKNIFENKPEINDVANNINQSTNTNVINSNFEAETLRSCILDNSNSIVGMVRLSPSMTTSYIPDYFDDLTITSENFKPGLGYSNYTEYKLGVLTNFYKLYDGINPELVGLKDINTGYLEKKDFLKILRKYPVEMRKETIEILREISKGEFSEEELVGCLPEFIDIFREFLFLVQERKT